MRIPKIVVFDLGKVLVDFDYGIAVRRIAARSQVSLAEVQKMIHESPLLFRYEIGQIRKEQFYKEVCVATGFCGDLEEFSTFFADIFTPIQPMVALQTRLRTLGFPTFILSNTNDMAIGHIRRNFPFFSNFDGYILSYEHGAMKPDDKLYQKVESLAGVDGEKILFIDDRKENVEAAVARGWNCIHHQNVEETVAAFQDILKPE